MTPEKQIIAIAEACGKKCPDCHGSGIERSCPDCGGFGHTACDGNGFFDIAHPCKHVQLPDYLNDLNAMHEAVQDQCRENPLFLIAYHAAVIEVAKTKYPLEASAAQRAEAFLRTIGKWEDE